MSLNSEPRELRYVDAVREALHQAMELDPRVFIMGLDVDDPKRILGSTKGLVEAFGPDRIFTTPLSEDAMTGVAIGAAMAGQRPVHVHIRVDFLMLCMNQLVNMAAKSHYMYGCQITVPRGVRAIIGKGWGQGAQHSQALHSMFMHVPGLKVVLPSNAHDAKGCMMAALRDDNPVLILEHRMLFDLASEVPEEPYVVPFGKARVHGNGQDITIVGISHMVVECLRAQELLAEIGVGSEVIDPISLVPLDMQSILDSVKRTGRLLVVDNAWTNCGASAEILARVAETPGLAGTVTMRRMGFAPTTCPTAANLEKLFYPNSATIATAANELVVKRSGWVADASRYDSSKTTPFRGPF